MKASRPEFGAREEKWLGDLSIKILEHFLPLFVGTYSGAPYRLDFSDMHPEKALSFLPHELHEIHLRMIWRRWKKKARMKILGKAVTPFGPAWIDRSLARCLQLKGDFVTDFRLIDYLACLMSTHTAGALNGTVGNDAKLKTDLTSLGTFHTTMPLYLLYRLRRYDDLGFSGFEGRHYSQFESIQNDLGHAASLQVLLSALAFQYIFRDGIHHVDIPDTPRIESERRQIFLPQPLAFQPSISTARAATAFCSGFSGMFRKPASAIVIRDMSGSRSRPTNGPWCASSDGMRPN
jgi:hypothetical protein